MLWRHNVSLWTTMPLRIYGSISRTFSTFNSNSMDVSFFFSSQVWKIDRHKFLTWRTSCDAVTCAFLPVFEFPQGDVSIKFLLREKIIIISLNVLVVIKRTHHLEHCTTSWSLSVIEWALRDYANPAYGVATICHQVRWLRWGHPSLFHTAASLLIWYRMFCVRDISYRLIWMEFINMFSMYAQSGTHSRFNW